MHNFVTYVVLISYFIFFAIPLTHAQESGIIGEVIPGGAGGGIRSGESVTAIKNIEPLFVNTTLVTEEGGQLSFILNDGTRLEVGSNSTISVNGELGRTSVNMVKGEMAFNVPQGSTLTVQTAVAAVDVPFDPTVGVLSTDPLTKNPIVGLISFDGQNISVFSERGDIKITDLVNGGVSRIGAGEQVAIAAKESVPPVTEVAAVGEGEVAKKPVAAVAEPGMSSGTKLLIAVGGALLAGGAVYAIAASSDDGGSPSASPSVP